MQVAPASGCVIKAENPKYDEMTQEIMVLSRKFKLMAKDLADTKKIVADFKASKKNSESAEKMGPGLRACAGMCDDIAEFIAECKNLAANEDDSVYIQALEKMAKFKSNCDTFIGALKDAKAKAAEGLKAPAA